MNTSSASQKKIAIVIGSLRKDSINKSLAHDIAARLDGDISYVDITAPLLNTDKMEEDGRQLEASMSLVKAADIVLIVSPEYNNAIPGGLKNWLDWISVLDQSAKPLTGKVVAMAGASPSRYATYPMQLQLRLLLTKLGGTVLHNNLCVHEADRQESRTQDAIASFAQNINSQ